MTRRLRVLLAGLGLIVAGNAVALLGVAYNRGGEPDAVVEFSERELAMPFGFAASEENSGLSLRLEWRLAEAPRPGAPDHAGGAAWLDRDKLAELGFDLRAAAERGQGEERLGRQLPREAWIVLELAGPAWQAAIVAREAALAAARQLQADNPGKEEFERRAAFAQEQLEKERDTNSRLFAIDAGPDRTELRRRYPDRARYLILPGEVRLGYDRQELTGFISQLGVRAVHVPLAERAAIERGGRYIVTLAFGRRSEPWILAALAGSGERPAE